MALEADLTKARAAIAKNETERAKLLKNCNALSTEHETKLQQINSRFQVIHNSQAAQFIHNVGATNASSEHSQILGILQDSILDSKFFSRTELLTAVSLHFQTLDKVNQNTILQSKLALLWISLYFTPPSTPNLQRKPVLQYPLFLQLASIPTVEFQVEVPYSVYALYSPQVNTDILSVVVVDSRDYQISRILQLYHFSGSCSALQEDWVKRFCARVEEEEQCKVVVYRHELPLVEQDNISVQDAVVLSVCSTLEAYPFGTSSNDTRLDVDITSLVSSAFSQRDILRQELTSGASNLYSMSAEKVKDDLHQLQNIINYLLVNDKKSAHEHNKEVELLGKDYSGLSVSQTKVELERLLQQFSYTSPLAHYKAISTIRALKARKKDYHILTMLEARLQKSQVPNQHLLESLDKIVRAISTMVVSLATSVFNRVEKHAELLFRPSHPAIVFCENKIVELFGSIRVTVDSITVIFFFL